MLMGLSQTRMAWLLLIALLMCGCSFPEDHLKEEAPDRPCADTAFEVGLWVQAEGTNRTLDSPEKIRALVKRARAAGVTDIYAQVYRSGRSWFRTSLADDAPARRFGQEPLTLLLDLTSQGQGNECPIRIHGWINVYALANNKDAPVIQELGEEAVLRDQYGYSLLDYPTSGAPEWTKGFGPDTRGIFLDPGNPDVRQRIIDLAAQLVSDYPRLAGVHLDYIRYPYGVFLSPGSRLSSRLNFGYNEGSVSRFEQASGRTAPRAEAQVTDTDVAAWDDWRRAQVTAAVRGVYEAGKRIREDVVVSAAVLAWDKRAYGSTFQDWRTWSEEGFLDKAVVMNYTEDERLAAQVNRSALASKRLKGGNEAHRGEVVIGLGAYKFTDQPAGLWRQWNAAKEAGADGVALFSYDQMVDNDAMWTFPESHGQD
ncbi:MAG: family 10 glycosylhydrolase [Synechococcus sp. SB0668_bin_15]|nr:family 10 glycosylhydrolase [Synechococcus sp. SB0668_bin_15]MYA91302.1 family 10 glycosylhydrolase [Synechococcus sp. SB0663_bin_10]MYC50291.1 family 10 glycosylhydrolase [Synechococcus sp. SB0662_bin_14]MYG47483.1 family 10 glycosylhydrolase [Synechococcus sp. SB0675_bin_6]MYJ59837.1 family 10 glycosylhydrolase [Synechococcus sp. SB0672_bin_6]MYK92247.1 family 10 glycosylhydrolase [Synechococcus sp. SB0669_bin_8]